MTRYRFNVQRLILDLGGHAQTAKAAKVTRSTPYGWVKREFISSASLCKILEWCEENKKRINIASYFEKIE